MRVLVLVFWALCAWPVAVAAQSWPALYDVTGVAANDVLNIRVAPNAQSQIIGVLAPNATNIELIQSNNAGTWAQINTAEQSGWISLRFMARQPGQNDAGFLKITSCFGTEPFWSLERGPNGLGFWSTPEEKAQVTFGRTALSYQSSGTFGLTGVYRPQTSDNNSSLVELTAIVRRALCTDGMSDRTYGLSIDILSARPLESGVFSGCCTMVP